MEVPETGASWSGAKSRSSGCTPTPWTSCCRPCSWLWSGSRTPRKSRGECGRTGLGPFMRCFTSLAGQRNNKSAFRALSSCAGHYLSCKEDSR